jgi:RimJ/RimL family protein N-acetyltransferase
MNVGTIWRMGDRTVVLRRLTPDDLPTVSPWFEDPDTRRYLGGPDWLRRVLELGEPAAGVEFRGATKTGAHCYLASCQGEPIGYIACGTFARWSAYGGEDENGPILEDIKEVPMGAIAFAVAPRLRGRGLCPAMIKALVSLPELASVSLFEAGVEPENVASARCLEAAGFRLWANDPSFEVMLYYLRSR